MSRWTSCASSKRPVLHGGGSTCVPAGRPGRRGAPVRHGTLRPRGAGRRDRAARRVVRGAHMVAGRPGTNVTPADHSGLKSPLLLGGKVSVTTGSNEQT